MSRYRLHIGLRYQIAQEQKVLLHSFRCGIGNVLAQDHPPITQDEAEAYLAQDLVKALNATLRYCPVLATAPENRLAAIVDFTFNLGAGRLQTSTLRRRINQMDWSGAAMELQRWVYGGGRVLQGLMTRREAEVQLMLCSDELRTGRSG